MTIEKENKFFIVNQKFINELPESARKHFFEFTNALEKKFPEITNKKYIACNQDEPYAEKVWQTILKGEMMKELKELNKPIPHNPGEHR